MDMVLCAGMGYLIGNLNPAYLFGKARGFDIRKRGSNNAGASNATLVMGKAVGAFCALMDILKAFAAYRLAKFLFPLLGYGAILASVCCVLGHIFPFWMHFNGGKGLASMGGMVLAHDWRLFLVLLLIEAIATLIIQYICFMPLSLCIIFPVIYGIQTRDLVGFLLLLTLIPVVFYRHRSNLQRIAEGKEMRLSWLWNAKAEEERLKSGYSSDEWQRIYRTADQKDEP